MNQPGFHGRYPKQPGAIFVALLHFSLFRNTQCHNSPRGFSWIFPHLGSAQEIRKRRHLATRGLVLFRVAGGFQGFRGGCSWGTLRIPFGEDWGIIGESPPGTLKNPIIFGTKIGFKMASEVNVFPRCAECMDHLLTSGEKWPHEQGEMANGKYSLHLEHLGFTYLLSSPIFKK